MAATLYTLVQHSGFGYARKPGFAQAVEIRAVSTVAQHRAVTAAGGLLFPDYVEADKAEERVNYPEEVDGLHPRCRGTFATVAIDGLCIYQPHASESFAAAIKAVQA